MDINIAETLFKAIEQALNGTLAGGTAKVMAGVGAVFGSVWTLQFTARSIYWLFQGLDVIVTDILTSILKTALIVYFAFNVSWYIQNVVPFVTDLPNWMGGILSGQDGNQTNQVDMLIAAFVQSVRDLIGAMQFGWTDDWAVALLGLLVLVLVLMGGIPFLSVCIATLFSLKASTSILLVVGPVFIAFAMFDYTRQWFFGWVSAVAGFMLANVFFSIAIALAIGFINTFVMTTGEFNPTLMGAFGILFFFGAFTLLATELPNHAAGIMGGVGGSGGGLGGMVGKATGLGTAMRMTRAAGRGLMKLRKGNRIQ